MNRRNYLFAGVAAAAGVAGAAWAWWRHQPRESVVTDPALQLLWSAEWSNPQGQPVDTQTYRGRPLLLNFWATWCPPCVDELPLLDTFYREQQPRGWQVVGLAIDQPSSVQEFLAKHSVRFPILMSGLNGTELGRLFGNESGGLPFTVVLDPAGQVLHRKLGRVSPQELEQWAQALP